MKNRSKHRPKSKATLDWSELKKVTRKEAVPDGLEKMEFIVNKFDEKEWTW